MIALNRNTLGVLDLANAGGRELAPVARLVARASDAQGEAITALRARPAPDLAGALDAEQRSLVALREALDTAQRLEDQQQQIENRRMLAQLRQRYRALLEREVALRANLDQYATKDELSRRERFEVRSLGEEQVAIADELATVRTETAELAEARVFDFAQTALERDAAEAAGALRDARAADAIPPADAAIATLSMLVRALEDAERQNNPFDDDNAGGGGGGGGAGQGQQPAIMPIHELKLLREMQATLLQRTRIAETAQNAAASERIAKDQTQLHSLGAELLQRIQSQSQGPMPPLRPEQAPTPEARTPRPPEAEQTPEPTNLPEGTEAPSHAA
jgi:DNA repair exonuclease SbcCD ATPase subunit